MTAAPTAARDGRSLRAMLVELAARSSVTLSSLDGGKRWLLSVIVLEPDGHIASQLHYEGVELVRVVRSAWNRAPGGQVP